MFADKDFGFPATSPLSVVRLLMATGKIEVWAVTVGTVTMYGFSMMLSNFFSTPLTE